jgi:hypothetical protein
MHSVFCLNTNKNSYFIFQEIQCLPISRIVYQESNNSVSFVASWSSWSNPYSLVADANYEKVANWKDLLDRSRSYNSYICADGGFNNNYWKSASRQNTTEKTKRHKDKSDTFIEFRIDKITKAVYNEFYFELYSPTISVIAFKRRSFFPYIFDDGKSVSDSDTDYRITYDPVSHCADNSYSVSWQNRTFNISKLDPEASRVSTYNVVSLSDLSSYWEKEDNEDENKLFDKELGNYFLDERDNKNIVNVGQKEIDLFLD